MAAGSKTKYTVTKANGKTVEIAATDVESESGRVRFFDGKKQIAEFAGVQDWHPSSDD